MRRIMVIVGIVIAVLVAGVWAMLRSPDVDMWLYRRMVDELGRRTVPPISKPHELSILLCGTGSPLPDPHRASACTLVAAGDRYYVVDVGLSSVKNLMLWRVPLEKVAGVFITHFHSDHIAELGELRLQTWVAGRKQPLKVYGPPGVERLVAGFNEAYALDAGYRTAHHGAKMLPPDVVQMVPVVLPMNDCGAAPALTEFGLKVTAIRVHHDPVKPAYGYRFDYGGRSVVVSGDTTPSDALVRASERADVLVHEAQSNEMVGILGNRLAKSGFWRFAKVMHDIPAYHTTPVDAARIANRAHVKLLVLSHINPFLPNAIAEHAFMRGVSDVRSDGLVMAHDGMLIHLPAGSAEIEIGDIE